MAGCGAKSTPAGVATIYRDGIAYSEKRSGWAWLGARWDAGYTLVLAPDNQRAELSGLITVDNRTGQRFAGVTVQLINARLTEIEPEFLRIPGLECFVLPDSPEIPSEESIELNISKDGALVLPVEHWVLVDPVGSGILDHKKQKPVTDKEYGTDKNIWPAHRYLAVVTPRPLPPGGIRVITSGRYYRSRHYDTNAEWTGSRLAAVLERTEMVTGKRWQADFFHDPVAHRLVEEIRVELTNHVDAPVPVSVLEHLYRGLSWTIAYHNEVTTPHKETPQSIRFNLTLPPRGNTTIVYRVVYTW